MDQNRMRQLAGITHTRPGLGESSQVGKTILQQMGGAGRIQVMLGAKNILLLDNGVSFRWPNKERSKGNAVRITLDPSDTYTMEFLNVAGSSAKSVKKYTGVYNDQLVDIFEKQTGWFLSLGGGKKSASGRKPGPEVDPSAVTSKQVASTKHASSDTFWTVSAIDGTFPTLDAAKKAWFSAGKPKPHGSSVWATEYRGEKTLQTITLNPSMEGKSRWKMLKRDAGDRKPVEIGVFNASSEADLAKAYETGQGHKLKKVGDGQYKVITKSNTVGSMVFILPADDLPKSESSLKTKLDELRELLGEAKAKAEGDSEWGETEDCECPEEDTDEECECAEEVREFSQDQLDVMAQAELEEAQTYAKAQADIMAGLEKDGWKVKRTGPDGKPMKVPHATSPNGDFKLFFKAQAIYKTHGQGDLGNARSLHLPDIRKTTYADFGAALSRWTGQDTKGNPLPKKGAVAVQPGDWDKAVALVKSDPKHQMTPDQYHQKHGECPDGYHFDASSKRCVKAKAEDVREMQRLSGINRYPDRALAEGAPVPRSMTAMVGAIRKYATGSLHPDWVVADEAAVAVGTGSPSGDGPLGSGSLEDGKGFQCMECGKKFRSVKAAENAQQNGCPKCGGTDIDLAEHEEDRTDLWHPDKDVKNPGLPTDKPKAAVPADKGHALLKALKCPPGKEPKLVFGRPSCAPTAKA